MNASNTTELMHTLGQQAQAASRHMARAGAATKVAALQGLARLLRSNLASLQAANELDLTRARAAGLAEPEQWPKHDRAISIRGLTPGMGFHLAECCHPVPGDRIVGIRRKGDSQVFVQLEDEQDLLDAPVYPDADAQGELDLVALQGKPVLIDVQALRGLFKAGDSILVVFVGTTKWGQVITHRLAPQTVQTLRTYTFQVPYADALALDGGSGEARYAVLRGGKQLYASLAAWVNFRSVVARLPAPEVTSAANGWLDNTLPSATVVIPVLAGATSQSRVHLSWVITSPSGGTYTHTQVYSVSANDIGKPISLTVPGVHFNGLTGRLEVSYRFQRDAASSLVDSAVQVLQVVLVIWR